MKKKLLGIFGTIIATAIGTIIPFYINQEKVEVKYSLSAPIAIPTENRFVQQLAIKNVGNASAENIIIKMKGNIQKYVIKKYSEDDDVKEHTLSDEIGKQLTYPSLPKDGGIVVIMDIKDSGLTGVEIKHNKGNANEVFSSQTKIGFVYIFFIISIIFYIAFSIKYFIDDYWILSVLQYDKKKILRKKQPFYLSESKWNKIKEVSIKNELSEIGNENFLFIEELKNSKAIFYLSSKNIEKLELTDEERKTLVSKTSEIYINNFRHLCNRLYSEIEYKKAFFVFRPELIEESKWDEERKNLFFKYEDYLKNKCYDFYDIPKTCTYIDNSLSEINISDIEKKQIKQDIKEWWIKEIKKWINGLSYDCGKKYIESLFQTEKPNYFSQFEWESINKCADNKYLEISLYELFYSSKEDCENLLKNESPKIKYLFDDNRGKITKFAKKLYCLFVMEDSLVLSYKELTDKYDINLLDSQLLTKILRLIDKAQSIVKLINSPIEDIEKLNISETVEASLWDSIIEYRSQKDELNKKQYEINAEDLKLKSKIEKVSKQLDFINSFLDSPNAIDRIEDYEDLFAKGNYENLRKLKEMFEKAK